MPASPGALDCADRDKQAKTDVTTLSRLTTLTVAHGQVVKVVRVVLVVVAFLDGIAVRANILLWQHHHQNVPHFMFGYPPVIAARPSRLSFSRCRKPLPDWAGPSLPSSRRGHKRQQGPSAAAGARRNAERCNARRI
jgi:hypothetical protein